MSNESKIYDGWTDDHAMTARESWTDKTDPEELKKYTCLEFPTPEPLKVKQKKKHVWWLKKAVVHRDFNLGKRKMILPEREFCIAPACDGECEKCNRVTVDELERVRENGLPCPFTGAVCFRPKEFNCEFRCELYLKIKRDRMKRDGMLGGESMKEFFSRMLDLLSAQLFGNGATIPNKTAGANSSKKKNTKERR